MRCRAGAAVVAFALATSAGAAHANGRFPRAQRLLEHPTDPDRLVLAATYGLLSSTDGGASFRYVCEAAYGEPDLTVDALTAFSAEGALLAGIYSGISRADADVCQFERTLGQNNRESVPDFTVVPGGAGEVLALFTTLPEQGPAFTRLQRSRDDARSWAPVGEALPPVMRTPLTLDSAPSNPARVYVTGLDEREQGLLLRSDDGGQTFAILELPTAAGEHPYLAAVDARDEGRLYLRTDAWIYDAATGSAWADDALFYSEDGGETFQELMRAPAKLYGFALSPDGSEVLLGYGDPREAGGARLTEASALGVYRAPAGSSAFRRHYAGSIGCLTWTERGIYLCTDEGETGYSLGWTDSAFASPVRPLVALADVTGPVECAPCSRGAVCERYWLSTCQSWGRDDCSGRDEPICRAEGGAGSGGGASARGGSAEADGGAEADEQKPPTKFVARGGCHCTTARSTGGAWTPVLLTAWLLTSRRRRGSSWCTMRRATCRPRSCEYSLRFRSARR